MDRIDLRGRRFGRLAILDEEPQKRHTRGGNSKVFWHCRCDCGNDVWVHSQRLRLGHTRSCGCLHDETARQRSTTHGGTGTAEWTAWRNMIARCTRPSADAYRWYGARGITVCDRWLHSFQAFLDDMGSRPGDDYSIERRDGSGSYCKENCYWADHRTQMNNMGRNVLLTLNGRTQTQAHWSRELGIHAMTLANRLRSGWSVERTLTTPVSHHRAAKNN